MKLLAILLLLCQTTFAAEKVKLQLNWVPEPEFGGIYEAQRIGAFGKHGLDVDIAAGGAGTATWQLVASSKRDFAVASADEVFTARQQGADVVAIYATYQTNPQGLMIRASRGIDNIADIFKQEGTLAVEPGLPYVTFLKNKYGFDKLKVVSYDGGIAGFLNDEKYAQQCFVTSEPLAAKKAGVEAKFFSVADAGYNPYTAVIITRGDYARSHLDTVKQLVAALQEGWRSYLDDPKGANDAMGKLNPDMDAATFAAAADAQKKLIETDETKKAGLGSMTKERWQMLGQQLLELKVIEKAADADACYINIKK
ncbi:MAG TPA: ABC transporter substrate-binding protein [Tepidisphaeraceae bacterium]|jgi:NitT/TauT family transport system substrate-binding protein